MTPKICERCGQPSKLPLHTHHKIPRSEGGSDSPDNLIEICSNCHFEIHHPDNTNGDPGQFDTEYTEFIAMNIFADGYGILPRKIMLDQEISPGSKLLYVELSSLCAERGYSWATNKYLSTKFNTSDKTISRWITEIEKYLYIENRAGAGRKIWVHTIVSMPKTRTKMSVDLDKNVQVNLDKKRTQNSISLNIKNNNLEAFEKFWNQYPRKVSKKKALVAWIRIKPDETTLKQILAALTAQMKSEQWQKDDGRFIPHPTTWLNGERWNDESKKEAPVQIVQPVTRMEARQIEKREYSPEGQKAVADIRAKLGKKLSMQ